MEKVVDRFINYVREFTTSDPESNTFPSTERQLEFGKKLVGELKSIGVQDVNLDENGYVTGSIYSNINRNCPVVGFIAHMDTSPDFCGQNVNPQIVQSYNGETLVLNEEKGVQINPKEFPEIMNYVGEPIITTDGTTLLGADDKAGIAEIISAAEYIILHPEIKHGEIKICFTPDEEIGKGADKFDVENFGADFAYTLDGGEIGELEFENFNAAFAKITIKGRSVHPGAAKNKMINAIMVGQKLLALLPSTQRPEHTEKYEGFYHILSFNGSVEKVEIQCLIRDHDLAKFKLKKQLLNEIIKMINLETGSNIIQIEMKDQYYNMREKIEPVMEIVELAKRAMIKAGVSPKIKAIRGGTDGARLSYMGLPCPNIFAGGHNFHGPYEFVPINSMKKAVEVIVNICTMIPDLKC